MRTLKKIEWKNASKYVVGGAIIVALVSCIFGKNIASAVTTSTNQQVTITYYTGKPSTDVSYQDAYLNGDSAVDKVAYQTKSIGRLQWGEQAADGTYSVYYDAADIHTLAAYLNESEEKYEELYESYLDAKKAVLE